MINHFYSKNEQYKINKATEEANKIQEIQNEKIAFKNNFPICIDVNLSNINEKNILEKFIQKNNLSNYTSHQIKQQYEIFWHLGTNSKIANELFNIQKNNALSDSKYKLMQLDSGDWIVPITTIIDNEKMVQEMASQLAIKAKNVKTGGNWKYRNLNELHFYQISNMNKLPTDELIKFINLGISHKPCNSTINQK